jgi:hypothetical protein
MGAGPWSDDGYDRSQYDASQSEPEASQSENEECLNVNADDDGDLGDNSLSATATATALHYGGDRQATDSTRDTMPHRHRRRISPEKCNASQSQEG